VAAHGEARGDLATTGYEAWLGGQIPLVRRDIELKHEAMRADAFSFFRATFYRWAQLWPKVCADLATAPKALAVGDLHVENFGTWRDAEGRLVWGVNDFDEVWRLPYTNDLARLATSAWLAIEESRLALGPEEATATILEGYSEAIEAGGRPFVLAESHKALRAMAVYRLKDPERFWSKLDALATLGKDAVPASARAALDSMMPAPDLAKRIVHRVAGKGSLGRQRFVALAEWRGGRIAREAKAMAPSAWTWASGARQARQILYQAALDRSIRCLDPCVRLEGRWLVRRLAPDCTRIDLSALPAKRRFAATWGGGPPAGCARPPHKWRKRSKRIGRITAVSGPAARAGTPDVVETCGEPSGAGLSPPRRLSRRRKSRHNCRDGSLRGCATLGLVA
jgi:hypothetical protein